MGGSRLYSRKLKTVQYVRRKTPLTVTHKKLFSNFVDLRQDPARRFNKYQQTPASLMNVISHVA